MDPSSTASHSGASRRDTSGCRGLLLASVMLYALAGCESLKSYDVTFNDVTVYEPAAVYRVADIEDVALHQCLEQTLIDGAITDPTALSALNCSDAGITSLAGLEQFSGLTTLKLSGNQIRNLLVLERLAQLRQLWLDRNDVVDPVPVLRLPALQQLDLTENPRLQCPNPTRIPTGVSVSLPEQCLAS